MRSRLYTGEVMHKRLLPFRHRFRYRVFSLLLDLDELPRLDRELRLFSHNRFNLFSFHDRDHGGRDGRPLRPWIAARLAEAGIESDIATDIAGGRGRIELLCFPRVLGYVFNPLTIWFCRDSSDRLRAVLYEVRNTFGDKHGYLLPVAEAHRPEQPLRQACAKGFHVSPFLPMDGGYRFRLHEPGERLSVLIREDLPEGEVLVATQTGRRAPLDDRRLARAFVAFPLLTLKVIAAIHWQALRLWLKGARFHRRPAPPAAEVTPVLDAAAARPLTLPAHQPAE